jgi:ABC-type microcin C transport system permease subunit YejB
MWKVFGGIALAFLAWQAINLRPVDLMTEQCKNELAANAAQNADIQTAIAAVKAGREIKVAGVAYRGAKAVDRLVQVQANLKEAMDSFDKRCKLF